MFGANKVSQSLIDAVNKVVGEETTEQVQLDEAKKRMLSDADLDETGFHKAAHAAKKANQTHFEFMGKKYPVTAKSHTEEYELDEEGNCVTPMKAKKIAKKEVKGHEKSMHHEEVEQIDELSRGSLLSYANKVSLDSQKHSKDPTKRSAEKASRSVTGYARAHNRLEKPVKEEVELEEAARLTPMYKKHVTRTTGSSFMDKAKSHGKNLSSVIKDLQGERDSIAKEHGYKHAIFHDKAIGGFKSAQKILAKEEVSELNFKDRLLEREMTKKEKAKRHEISGAMEKDPSYFKKKYGARWKEVMYATATKKAMGEEVEQIDEISDKTLANYVTAARKDREHNKVNKSAPDTAQRANANERDKKRIAGMNKANSYLTPGTAGHSKNQARRAANEEVEQIDEYHKIQNEVDEISTDMLSGREQGEGRANSFKNFKVKIQGSLKTSHEPDMEKGHTTKASETVKASGGAINPVTQPNIGVEGKGNVEFSKQGFAETVEEGWDDMLNDVKKRSGPQPNGDAGIKLGTRYGGGRQRDEPELKGNHQGATNYAPALANKQKENKKKVTSEGKDPEMDAGAGSAPNFTTSGNVTSSPMMDRVKDITKKAMKRVKNEMLGIAPGNQTNGY